MMRQIAKMRQATKMMRQSTNMRQCEGGVKRTIMCQGVKAS